MDDADTGCGQGPRLNLEWKRALTVFMLDGLCRYMVKNTELDKMTPRPVWTEKHTRIAKRLDEAVAKTPIDQWKQYTSYTAFLEKQSERTS